MIPKRLSPKCPTDLKFLTSFVKSGLCFIFATPFCNVFVSSNVYQSHFFCTCCALQTFFVPLVNLRFTIKFCFTKLAAKFIFVTPFCTIFVYSNVYQSYFFCTYCALQFPLSTKIITSLCEDRRSEPIRMAFFLLQTECRFLALQFPLFISTFPQTRKVVRLF